MQKYKNTERQKKTKRRKGEKTKRQNYPYLAGGPEQIPSPPQELE